MRRVHACWGWTAVLLLTGSIVLLAHPHLRKTVTVKLGEVEAVLSYYTSPSNVEHIEKAQVGVFNPAAATLKLSADLVVGDATLSAGEYRIGAIKNGPDDFTLALYQGQLKRGQLADNSKVVKLASSLSKSQGNAAHIYFDILPGQGAMEGRITLVWHYGPYYLAGALS